MMTAPVLAIAAPDRATVAESAAAAERHLDQYEPESALAIAMHLVAVTLARQPPGRLIDAVMWLHAGIRTTALDVSMGETAGSA